VFHSSEMISNGQTPSAHYLEFKYTHDKIIRQSLTIVGLPIHLNTAFVNRTRRKATSHKQFSVKHILAAMVKKNLQQNQSLTSSIYFRR